MDAGPVLIPKNMTGSQAPFFVMNYEFLDD